jgi:hypothetical protein
VTGGVPDLQFDLLLVDLHLPNLEVNSDCGHEVVSESVILIKRLGESVLNPWFIRIGDFGHLLTENRSRSEDFPTPELPMSRTLNR